MRWDRTVIGYHGCDADVAERLLRGEAFEISKNDYDWLGRGTYFWEFGADRALKFATEQIKWNRVKTPSVVGAVIQLGNCFDLLDTRFTTLVAQSFDAWLDFQKLNAIPIPTNSGRAPDKKLRRLDCAVMNWLLDYLESESGERYDTVRCAFEEGGPAFPESKIMKEAHIQIAVRNPKAIIGAFRPTDV